MVINMIIGVRAHDFGKLLVEELAKKIHGSQASCIQLALAKAISGQDSWAGKLNPGLASYIRETFYKENIKIAVLGCYVNLAHPDRAKRKELINYFKEHIRYARDFGCSIIGTETGSINADYSFNPENHSEYAFKQSLETIKELVEEAEKFGVFVGIEGVASHIINTPEKMKKVIDTIKSNNLQVIFDPVNLLTFENYKNQDEIIKESFELFGDRISIIHSKDFIIEDGKIKSVATGKGMLNYELLLGLIKNKKPYIELLLEDTKELAVEESIRFLKNIYASM